MKRESFFSGSGAAPILEQSEFQKETHELHRRIDEFAGQLVAANSRLERIEAMGRCQEKETALSGYIETLREVKAEFTSLEEQVQSVCERRKRTSEETLMANDLAEDLDEKSATCASTPLLCPPQDRPIVSRRFN